MDVGGAFPGTDTDADADAGSGSGDFAVAAFNAGGVLLLVVGAVDIDAIWKYELTRCRYGM